MRATSGRSADRSDAPLGRRRQNPSDTTYREAEYIDWLSKNRVPVVIKLVDGEEVKGWIEYYDRDIIRLTRQRGSNLFIYKERVKYLYEDPAGATPRRRSPTS